MKMIYLSQVNGPLPCRPSHGGWGVHNGEQAACDLSEAEAFRLLGGAIEHYELMGKAIAQLRKTLGLT